MDMMCLCLVSARARMWGVGSAYRRAYKSMIVMCMLRVLRVLAVISGCV